MHKVHRRFGSVHTFGVKNIWKSNSSYNSSWAQQISDLINLVIESRLFLSSLTWTWFTHADMNNDLKTSKFIQTKSNKSNKLLWQATISWKRDLLHSNLDNTLFNLSVIETVVVESDVSYLMTFVCFFIFYLTINCHSQPIQRFKTKSWKIDRK